MRIQPLFIHKPQNNSQIFFPIQSTYESFFKGKRTKHVSGKSLLQSTGRHKGIQTNLSVYTNHTHNTKAQWQICLDTTELHPENTVIDDVPQVYIACITLCPDSMSIFLILLVPQELMHCQSTFLNYETQNCPRETQEIILNQMCSFYSYPCLPAKYFPDLELANSKDSVQVLTVFLLTVLEMWC